MKMQEINKTIERTILLNPGPATTTERVKKSLIVADICPREKEFGTLLANVRSKVVDVVNGGKNYEGILLGSSGTGAIESCLSSCVSENEQIIIIENGAYGKRMGQICEALNINYELLKFDWNIPLSLDLVEKHLINKSKEAKVLAYIHHETTTGVLNPIDQIHDLAKKYGLVSMVDAMSSYAGIPIDLEKTDVDYLISSSNKCIHGMAGIGIVLCKNEELLRISKLKSKSFYFDLYKNFVSQKEKGQFLFTPPVQTLYALNEALDEFNELGGIDTRWGKYSNLHAQMLEGLFNLGFQTLIDESEHSKVLTTFFEPKNKNYSFDKMHDFLFEKGITIYPGKVTTENTFRISNIGDLNPSDIEIFLSSMKEYLESIK